jgi:Methyltransferase domain
MSSEESSPAPSPTPAPVPIPPSPTYSVEEMTPENRPYLPDAYQGRVYRISTNWLSALPLPTGPIRIMEIGVFHGGNVCSLTKTYAHHPASTIHCVDPWLDYEGYTEYQGQQMSNYRQFIQNISLLPPEELNKIHLHRGLSSTIIPTFPDHFFDLIYVDGNHDIPYVVEDAILALRKVKNGGHLIFDDAYCPEVQQGVDLFIALYRSSIQQIVPLDGQLLLQIQKPSSVTAS